MEPNWKGRRAPLIHHTDASIKHAFATGSIVPPLGERGDVAMRWLKVLGWLASFGVALVVAYWIFLR